MADQVEMQDIQGLDIDKLIKGRAERMYVFKQDCTIASMSKDSVRWFQETSGELTATSPLKTKNVSPLSLPTSMEPSWTRNTSYPKKYFVEGTISMEDIKAAEINVLARTIIRLGKVVVRDVDADIYDVMSESGSPSNIQTFATTDSGAGGDQWDAASYAGNPLKDILEGKRLIWSQDYDPEGASLHLHPTDYKNLIDWLIAGKGSSIPGFSSEKVSTGTVTRLLGVNIKVSNNVGAGTRDEALMIVPKVATTWSEQFPITANREVLPGLGTRVRIWTHGIAYNTDPKAIVLITDLRT